MASKVSGYLADNIENLRAKKKLSQQRLAALAGIPRSTLTNIASGAGNPSLENLVKIADALGVGIEELLSRPRTDVALIPAVEVPVQERGASKAVRIAKLLPDRIKGIEIDRIEFAPGAGMGGHPHVAGTKEYLHVLRGELVVHVGGEAFKVEHGDVLAFPGNQPHSYRNSGAGRALALSVVIPVPAAL